MSDYQQFVVLAVLFMVAMLVLVTLMVFFIEKLLLEESISVVNKPTAVQEQKEDSHSEPGSDEFFDAVSLQSLISDETSVHEENADYNTFYTKHFSLPFIR
ncbi:hypothetical protein [Ehrlichia japonica]|uniref:Uncharacterized protein n=1 Tax=Ehrlichia japonica TaxID=391036 RepID=X5GBF8_9RICK|nr:hypothetical protein [Ehrlichia japonica]AHX04422.1 hypothetical protein EHF_0244 [Ehrlichia japonica]